LILFDTCYKYETSDMTQPGPDYNRYKSTGNENQELFSVKNSILRYINNSISITTRHLLNSRNV